MWVNILKTFLFKMIKAIWYLLASLLLLAAVLVSIAHLMTPLLNRHHADFEAWASFLLQVPVSIEEVHVDWRGYTPEFSLSHVIVLDKQTRKPAFDVQEIKIGFQLFSSLWKRQIVLQDIILSGANVTVLQDASGQLSIKDLPVHEEKDLKAYRLMDILEWIFSQPYLALHDLDVRFVPYKGEYKELSFHKVSLLNKDNLHKISSSFTLHQEIPTEIKTQIEWSGKIADWSHTKGHAYINLAGFSLPQWLKSQEQVVNQLLSSWQIHQGIGGANIWLDWENRQLQQVQSIFQWYDLEFYSVFDQKTYPLQRLSGHVGWKREGEKQIFAGDSILIDFPQHLWPATTFYVVLSSLPLKENAGVSADHTWHLEKFRVGYVDLQDILPVIMANAGLPATWRKNITSLNPTGDLQNIDLSWRASLTAFDQTSFSGEAQSLSFLPFQHFPGVTHLSGRWEWNGKTGNVQLASHDLNFTLHSIFTESLSFDEVIGHVSIERDRSGFWSFQSSDMIANNTDINTKAAIQMTFPTQHSPTVDLKATFTLAHVAHVVHYLPTGILDHNLVTWIKDAFLKGSLVSGKAIMRGNLKDFPFDGESATEKKGVFNVSGELKDIDFHYAPYWPIIRQAQGQLNFVGRSMQVYIDSALIMDIPIEHISSEIPYIGEERPAILNVRGQIQSDLVQAMTFIHQSPLEKTIGKALRNLQLQGDMTLGLSLAIPLYAPEEAKVVGQVQVAKGKLVLPTWGLGLEQLHGSFQFTEHDISADKLQGILWGEPTVLSLSTIAATEDDLSHVEAKITGMIDIAHMDSALNLSLGRFLSGTTAYQARLDLYKKESEADQIYFHSDLQGIAIDLPAPYGKNATEKRNFALNFSISSIPQYLAHLKYGDLIQAQLKIWAEKDFRLIDIDSAQLKGRVRFSYPFDHKEPIQAQLEKVAITSSNEKTISSLDPQSLPPLEIIVRQFIYEKMNLGQLVLNTIPKSNGMIIQNFNLSAPDYYFKSHGLWTVVNKMQKSQIQGSIQSMNVRKFLGRLGIQSESLIVDKGQANFDLQWKGAPYSFSLQNILGSFYFALEKGRIINLNEANNNKMDLGRMLSLFSLQTIPRRLSLDFSDLFEQGYSFDFIRGNFNLRQGDAYTQKEVTLEGPVASVKAYGRIGLLNKDYDLHLSISPHVTESLPIVAGAITLNPFVGAAAWLVNKMVLSNQVSKVITYNYTVTGPWSNPIWQSTSPN